MSLPTQLVSPSKLPSKLEADQAIAEYVTQLLDTISIEINAAISRRARAVEIDAPTEFYVTGMHNEEAQRHVYYHTLRTLEKHNYRAGIRFVPGDTQKVKIRVTWRSIEDEKRDQHMDEYISQHIY